jgi:hypothetical protein
MVGSLIQVGSVRGVVVDAALSPNGSGLVHKIKWLPDRYNPNAWRILPTWRVLKNLTDLKVLVKRDMYGEEQAGL